MLVRHSNWDVFLLTWGVGETSPRSLLEPRSRERGREFSLYIRCLASDTDKSRESLRWSLFRTDADAGRRPVALPLHSFYPPTGSWMVISSSAARLYGTGTLCTTYGYPCLKRNESMFMEDD